ncbi:MAG: DUF459 domain-containing protein [Hyphomicrobiaceae bacterium]
MRARWVVNLLGALTLLAGALPAVAQDDLAGPSFITPFPENDTYRMLVLGDTLANGLADGLAEAMSGAEGVQLQRKARPLNGLSRSEFEEDLKALEDPAWREPLHIAVVMLGVWDRMPLRNPSGRRVLVGSPEWRDLFGQRVDRVMKILKRKKAAVYWVGLPVMRRSEATRDIETINEIFRERAFLNGLKFIDAYAGFADEDGNFNPYGPDVTGKMRLLRENDGVHFTEAGNRKLAHFVERVVRRDLNQAKSERSIPLLGTEAEQRRVSPNKGPDELAAGAAAAAAAKGTKGGSRPASAGTPASPAEGEQKADNGRIQFRIVSAQGREETVTFDLPRPAIPARVMALVTRRESIERPSQLGDTLTDEIAGGLLVMTSVTPAADSAARRRMAPTQAPFFRVLVKGERVLPKPGRIDDFSWPKPEQSAEAEGAAPAGKDAGTVRARARGG